MKTSISLSAVQPRAQESPLTAPARDIGRKDRVNTADLSFKLLFSNIRPGATETPANRVISRQPEQVRIEKPRQPRQRPRDEDQIAPPQVQQDIRNNPSGRARETADAQRTMKPVSGARQPDRSTERQSSGHSAQADALNAPARTASSNKTASTTPANEQAAQSAPATRPASPAEAGANMPAQTTAASQAAQSANTSSVASGAASVQQLASNLQQAATPALQPVTDAEATRLAQEAGLLPTASASAAAGTAQAAAGLQTATTQNVPDHAAEGITGDTLPTDSLLTPAKATGTAADAGTTGQQQGQGHQQAAREPAPALPQTAELRTTLTAGAASATPENSEPGPAVTGIGLRTDGAGFSLGMAAQPTPAAHSPVRADGSPLLASRIDSPVNSQEFRELFARQVTGLVMQGQDRAEIRLTPAELGPIRIRLTLNAEDAQLDISAAHASTRAAIEASMSTLKQMLADQGMRLTDYRMDQGNTASFMSQQRQSDQGGNAGMQQSMTAFGQGNGSGSSDRQGQGEGGRGRDANTTGAGSAAAAGGTNGTGIVRHATPEGNIDTFA